MFSNTDCLPPYRLRHSAGRLRWFIVQIKAFATPERPDRAARANVPFMSSPYSRGVEGVRYDWTLENRPFLEDYAKIPDGRRRGPRPRQLAK